MAKQEKTDLPKSSKENKGSKHTFRKKFFINIICMGVIAAVLLVLTMMGLRWYTRHGEEIDVPNLKGLTLSQAVNKLQALGLVATIDDSIYIKNQVPNTIYNQSITPGSHVKVGRTVGLTINTSQPPMIFMPDIADNSSVREATMKLTVLGLKMGDQEFINGEKDWVYAVKVNGKNVTAGERIPSDAKVTLVVGDGTYFDSDFDSEYYDSSSDSIILDDNFDIDLGSEVDPL